LCLVEEDVDEDTLELGLKPNKNKKCLTTKKHLCKKGGSMQPPLLKMKLNVPFQTISKNGSALQKSLSLDPSG